MDRNPFCFSSLPPFSCSPSAARSMAARRRAATTATWGGSGRCRGDEGCCSGSPLYVPLLAPELLASQLLLFIRLPAMVSQGKMQTVVSASWILSTSSRFYAIVRLICESPWPTPGLGELLQCSPPLFEKKKKMQPYSDLAAICACSCWFGLAGAGFFKRKTLLAD